MQKIITKGLRLQRPAVCRISLRHQVYERLCELGVQHQCSPNVLIQGIIEDFCDKLPAELAPDDCSGK